MSEWLALSEALPELGLARHDIELLALSRLSEEDAKIGRSSCARPLWSSLGLIMNVVGFPRPGTTRSPKVVMEKSNAAAAWKMAASSVPRQL